MLSLKLDVLRKNNLIPLGVALFDTARLKKMNILFERIF